MVLVVGIPAVGAATPEVADVLVVMDADEDEAAYDEGAADEEEAADEEGAADEEAADEDPPALGRVMGTPALAQTSETTLRASGGKEKPRLVQGSELDR